MNDFDTLVRFNDKVWNETGTCLIRCIDEPWADECPWRSM